MNRASVSPAPLPSRPRKAVSHLRLVQVEELPKSRPPAAKPSKKKSQYISWGMLIYVVYCLWGSLAGWPGTAWIAAYTPLYLLMGILTVLAAFNLWEER